MKSFRIGFWSSFCRLHILLKEKFEHDEKKLEWSRLMMRMSLFTVFDGYQQQHCSWRLASLRISPKIRDSSSCCSHRITTRKTLDRKNTTRSKDRLGRSEFSLLLFKPSFLLCLSYLSGDCGNCERERWEAEIWGVTIGMVKWKEDDSNQIK